MAGLINDHDTNKKKVIIQGVVIWLGFIFILFWFWDIWQLDGPHGPYRWVGMDFVPFWVGVQEMLDGLNPYTPEVTLKIQQEVYGGPAGDYDPMMFVYPAWLFVVILPFSLIPLKWAVLLYGSALILLLFLLLRNLSLVWTAEKTKIFFLLLLIFGALPFVIVSVTKGQLGYISLIGLYLALYWWKEKPILAGIALGFALIKPTVTVIPVIGFLFWAFYARRWSFYFGFVGLMFFLSLTSFAASGFWIPEYIQMLSITGGMPVLWSAQILAPPWNYFYILYFLALLGFGLLKAINTGDNRPWFSATVLTGMGLTPMRWIYDLFLGILVPNQNPKISFMSRVSLGLAILSPWLLVFVDETIRGEFAVIFLPLIWSLVFLVENIPFGRIAAFGKRLLEQRGANE